jgi:urocanate hydratase
VVGSQAKILYADAEGRVKIATFNQAIAKGILPCFFGQDHHDVSGTDSPLQGDIKHLRRSFYSRYGYSKRD